MLTFWEAVRKRLSSLLLLFTNILLAAILTLLRLERTGLGRRLAAWFYYDRRAGRGKHHAA
jgi:hypothetical protein